MRLLLLAAFFFLMTGPTNAQPDGEVYQFVEQEPYFKGCEQYTDQTLEKKQCSTIATGTFIAENLVYPPLAIEKNIEGIVYVRFTINTDGTTADLVIVRDIGYGCGDAALEVVRKMPPWQPGYQQGQPVRVAYTLPIRFSLEGRNTENAEGYSLSWGNLVKEIVSKKAIHKNLSEKIIARDDLGNIMSISDLSFSRERDEAFEEIHSNGTITPRMVHLVQKLRKGDTFILTATVQKDGQFYYINKPYRID